MLFTLTRINLGLDGPEILVEEPENSHVKTPYIKIRYSALAVGTDNNTALR